jgi:hypothetical protein
MLISETHFTGKSYVKLPISMNHSDGTAQDGTTIIITNFIKHRRLNYSQNFLQATSVPLEDTVGLLPISVVYLPPRYAVKQDFLQQNLKYVRASEITMQSIPTGDPDLIHPMDASSSKGWKETT